MTSSLENGVLYFTLLNCLQMIIDDLNLPVLTSPPEEPNTTTLSILSWPACQGQCFHTDRVYIHGFGEKKL